jgi:hypothetical protein
VNLLTRSFGAQKKPSRAKNRNQAIISVISDEMRISALPFVLPPLDMHIDRLASGIMVEGRHVTAPHGTIALVRPHYAGGLTALEGAIERNGQAIMALPLIFLRSASRHPQLHLSRQSDTPRLQQPARRQR